MARKPRNKALSARVDDIKHEEVIAYTDATHIDVADLVRFAVDEYMVNHPVNVSKEG